MKAEYEWTQKSPSKIQLPQIDPMYDDDEETIRNENFFNSEENLEELEWEAYIKKYIKMKKCIRYLPAKSDAQLCQCNRKIKWHVEHHHKSETLNEWKPSLEPCNCFGKIKFKSFKGMIPQHEGYYVRVAADSKRTVNSSLDNEHKDVLSHISRLILKKWKFVPPQLIVSMNGGAQAMGELTVDDKSALKEGLMNIAQEFNTWIVTSGFNSGVASLVGEARRDFGLKYGGYSENSKSLIAIGIGVWGAVFNRGQLKNNEQSHVYYENVEGALKSSGECTLEPNHDIFLLWDNGTIRKFGTEIEFRVNFEKYLHEYCKQITSQSRQIREQQRDTYLIQLLYNGGEASLETTLKALKKDIPVVVIKGSQRAADWISAVAEAPDNRVEDVLKQETDKMYVNVAEPLRKAKRDEIAEKLREIRSFYGGEKNLLLINHNINLKKSMHEAIFRGSLIFYKKQEGVDASPDIKLNWAVNFNCFEAVKNEIFKAKETPSMTCIEENLKKCLKNHQYLFVDFLLKNDVNIESFFTEKTMYEIYMQSKQKSMIKYFKVHSHILKDEINHHTNEVKFTKEQRVLNQIGERIQLFSKNLINNPYFINQEERVQQPSNILEWLPDAAITTNVKNLTGADVKKDIFLPDDNQISISINFENIGYMAKYSYIQIRVDGDPVTKIKAHALESTGKIIKEANYHDLFISGNILFLKIIITFDKANSNVFQLRLFNCENVNKTNVLQKNEATEQNGWDTLRAIGSRITNLGRYTVNRSESTSEHITSDKIEIHNIGLNKHEKLALPCACCPRDSYKTLAFQKYPLFKREGGRQFDMQDMFFWSLLMNNMEMTLLFWKRSKNQIGLALSASIICMQLARRADNNGEVELSTQLNSSSRYFEILATKVISKAYEIDREHSHLLLIRAIPTLNRQTCLEIADEGGLKVFLSQSSCRTLLNRIWRGRIPLHLSAFKILINLVPCFGLFSKFILFREQFFEDEKSVDDENIESKQYLNRYKERVKLKKSSSTCCNAIRHFYTAPITKFTLNTIFYLAFLVIFAILNMSYLKPINQPRTNTEKIVEYLVYMFQYTNYAENILIAVRIRWFHQYSVKSWFTGLWNWMFIVQLALSIVGIVLRHLPNVDFVGARVCYAIVLSLHILMFIERYIVNKTIGPKVIMVRKMLNDLIFFLCIYAAMVAAYGTLMRSLAHPQSKLNPLLFKNVFYQPYWQTYGELDLDKVEGSMTCTGTGDTCIRHNAAVIIAFAIFMLSTNILMLNLLIAKFGHTFSKIQADSKKVWAYNRYNIIKRYYLASILPPPLNIFEIVYSIINASHQTIKYKKAMRFLKSSEFICNLQYDDDLFSAEFENLCVELSFFEKDPELKAIIDEIISSKQDESEKKEKRQKKKATFLSNTTVNLPNQMAHQMPNTIDPEFIENTMNNMSDKFQNDLWQIRNEFGTLLRNVETGMNDVLMETQSVLAVLRIRRADATNHSTTASPSMPKID